MQDFAKSRSFQDAEIPESEAEWSLDGVSVIFGALLGAIVMVAGLKIIKVEENQGYKEQKAGEVSEVNPTKDFEFYDVLKCDDLYPPLSR